MSAYERFKVTYTETSIPQPLQDGDGDSLSNDLVLSDEQNNLVLSLTANQYTELLSAAYNGAQRAFPDRYIEVIYPLIKAGKLEFCEQVAQCIGNDPLVQSTIENTIINNSNLFPNQIDPENTTGIDKNPTGDTQSVSSPPPSCDKDALWAGIREMVERIDQNGRDVLEDLQFLNDKIEQWAEIIDLVPLLGDTIKDIGDLFTAQIPDLLNAYNSASSPVFLDNVACDLFEMVCQDCRYPTFQEVVDYFGSLSYVQIPAFNVLTYGGLWSLVKTVSAAFPEPVWYTVNVWQAFTLSVGGVFKKSYGENTFAIWASFGEDNPNNNWELICDGCGETWCYEWSLANGNLDQLTPLVISGFPRGVYIPNEGWGGNPAFATGNKYIQFEIVFPQAAHLTHVEIDSAINPPNSYYQLRVDGFLNPNQFSQNQITQSLTGSFDCDIPLALGAGVGYDDSAQSAVNERVTAVRIYGEGVNPYGVNNCNP